jgi:hypothetical protein
LVGDIHYYADEKEFLLVIKAYKKNMEKKSHANKHMFGITVNYSNSDIFSLISNIG